MRFPVSKRQLAGSILGLAAFSAAAGLAWRGFGEGSLPILLVLAAGMLLLAGQARGNSLRRKLEEIETRSRRDREADFRQMEALLSLYATLRPDQPLPETRAWAASPDFLKRIMDAVLSRRPELVVEASCGASTLVIGHCLRKLGKGKVVSLEHDPFYAAQTRERAARHGLEGFVTVLDAPLAQSRIGSQAWPWYSLDRLKPDRKIDILVIDGPPAGIGKLARYPAIPLLYGFLAPEAMVLLDDAGRSEEKECVRRWTAEYPDFEARFLDLEKGACELTRIPGRTAGG